MSPSDTNQVPLRPLTEETAAGPFDIFWRGEMMFSQNNAVGRRDLPGWNLLLDVPLVPA